ncbi:alcohol dehydrogenase [Halobacillus sp. BAB-2008]|nr:alcohol dehydrogenase [Halobacillus sp. BAB-2008]
MSRIPSGVSFAEAAALPTAGYTAYQAVHRKLPLDRVNSLLIHAGAGGVGGFAVQLAKMAGKTVYTTASEHNHEYVRSLGADGVIDYRQEDVHTKIMEWTEGRGVDAVIDTVSRDNATASLDSIAYMGHIVYIAGAPDFTKVKPFTSVVSYHEVALAANHKAGREARKDLGMMGDAMLRFVADKKLSPMLKDTVAMEEVPAALERLSERHVNGKLVAVWK